MDHSIKVDIIPYAINDFLRENPTIGDIIGATDSLTPHSSLLEFLREKHREVLSYHIEREVPEGKGPALFIGLYGIPGYFVVLPDRHYNKSDVYQAICYHSYEPYPEAKTSDRVSVEWIARHITENKKLLCLTN